MASKRFTNLEEDFYPDETKAGEPTQYLPNILVDADVLVAIAKKDDSNHTKALAISKDLQEKGAQWYVSPFTVAETVTVLSYKVSQREAKAALKEIRKLDNFLPLSLKENEINIADKWFLKQEKKGTSYFDCYNMALLEKHNKFLSGIFSFDSVYARNGFNVVK